MSRLIVIIIILLTLIFWVGYLLFGKNIHKPISYHSSPPSAKADFPDIIQDDSNVIDNAVQQAGTYDNNKK